MVSEVSRLRGVAGCLGGFRCVLGQIARDHAVGDGAVRAGVDGADVELGAPGDEPAGWLVRVRGGDEHGRARGVLDGVDQVADPMPHD
jgi:hypothetical protein